MGEEAALPNIYELKTRAGKIHTTTMKELTHARIITGEE